jgi:hypothetical protein
MKGIAFHATCSAMYAVANHYDINSVKVRTVATNKWSILRSRSRES